jgi:hypothetical protein
MESGRKESTSAVKYRGSRAVVGKYKDGSTKGVLGLP